MTLTEALAWLTLIVAFPLMAFVTYKLRKAHRAAPQLRVLKERYIVAVVTTCVVLFFGLIFVQNDLTPPPLDLDVTKVITRAAILFMALVVSGGWLWIYSGHGKR